MRWIPVTESLPDTRREVFVLDDSNGEIDVAQYLGPDLGWTRTTSCSHCESALYPVTHWCAPPERPE
jgi:hypothetical protein